MDDLLVMPSDYTGSGGADRATGPFAQQRSNIARLVDLLELENQNRGEDFLLGKRKESWHTGDKKKGRKAPSSYCSLAIRRCSNRNLFWA